MTAARIPLRRPTRARRLPRLRPRTLLLALAAVALLAGGGLWVRGSPLFAVTKVEVLGATGAQSALVRNALRDTGLEMSTLHVREARLREAVAGYPSVRTIEVDSHPLHRLTIRVIEWTPVAVVSVGSRRVAVAEDGTLLRDRSAAADLPEVPGGPVASARRLTGTRRLQAVRIAAAAPAELRPVIQRVRRRRDGWVADMRGGMRVALGDALRLRAKWAAAARVMADPLAAGAAYVDVRAPERPVAGPFDDSAPDPPAAPQGAAPEDAGSLPQAAEGAESPSSPG